MDTDNQQRFVLLLTILITCAILTLDALLWSTFGYNATLSRTFDWVYKRWPICAAIFFIWVGIVVGHLLPMK